MAYIRVQGSVTILGKVLNFMDDYAAEQQDVIDELEIPIGATDQEVTFAPGTFAKMTLLAFKTDGALTIKCYNVAAQGLTLTGLDGFAVYPGAAAAALTGTAITKLLVTNGTGVARKLSVYCGRDITP